MVRCSAWYLASIMDGVKGGWVWRWGKRQIIYQSLHCHQQHNSCIKMGSDEILGIRYKKLLKLTVISSHGVCIVF